jgi:hypothetical protein
VRAAIWVFRGEAGDGVASVADAFVSHSPFKPLIPLAGRRRMHLAQKSLSTSFAGHTGNTPPFTYPLLISEY